MSRRPMFLDAPGMWTRASRSSQSVVDNACVIEHVQRKTSAAATVIFSIVLALLLAALFVHYATPCAEAVLCTLMPMARCNADACRQGEIPCPCPERCCVPEEDRLPGDGSLAWVGMSLLIASALVVIFGVLFALS